MNDAHAVLRAARGLIGEHGTHAEGIALVRARRADESGGSQEAADRWRKIAAAVRELRRPN